MGKTILIVSIVIGALLIGGISYAKYRGFCSGPESKADWVVYRMTNQLDLDAQQQERLEGFRDKALSLLQNMREERPQQMQMALGLLEAPQLDRQQAYQMWEVKHNWMAAAGPQLIDAFADFSDSLNQDQRSKLQAMITQHRNRHAKPCCEAATSPEQE
ncbi:MAG: Spy/CpxP family protein refolding chaperone [Gammaproteobacteria bacterium]|nr:Spy/CpxP family protein refolding chaperone [Gammaproteobacteria bacterium]